MTLDTTLMALFVAMIALIVAVIALRKVKDLREAVERKEEYQLREIRYLLDGFRALSYKHVRLLKALDLVEAPTEQPRYVKDSKKEVRDAHQCS